MAITKYNIRKWLSMLMGKSILHVNQDIGKYFSKSEILGYYNNMMEKVLKSSDYLESQDLPHFLTENDRLFYFPVGIFQYAFGLLDLYYQSNDIKYLNKFEQCSKWALTNQLNLGAWDNFSYYYPQNPFGAMAQGEGASVLIRAYKLFGDEKYLDAAKKAIDFMLKPKNLGGCTDYDSGEVVFLEYPHRKAVLNGWIFAWWGLYDYVLITNDQGQYHRILNESCDSIKNYLKRFTTNYWSKYDLEGRISSPFYHNLHIAQMQAMAILTNDEVFNYYAKIWEGYQKNFLFKTIAFIKKSFQKIAE